jgi:hypothetical protein
MKRFAAVLAVVVVALMAGVAPAQETGLVGKGIKIGLSMSSFGGDDRDIEKEGMPETRYGLGAGGFLTFGLGPNLALQPEVLYVMKGAKFGQDDDGFTIKFAYLDVPVLFKYRFPTTGSTRPSLYAGPVGSIKLTADARLIEDGIETKYDYSDYVKDSDFGMAVGGGLDFEMAGNTITFDLRHTFGLTEWPVEAERPSVKNNGWLALVGVGF